MVAPLAYGEGNGEAILFWGKRASGIGRVGAGRIFEVIEIQDKVA